MEIEIKKKRGRKPKNFTFEQVVVQQPEKRKRGRKKKYEVENFEKILNRDEENNFNHNVVYSDDESNIGESCVKKIAFGNLDITVSKKIESEDTNDFKLKTRKVYSEVSINTSEYSSDDEKEIPVESFVNVNEKNFSENKRYTTKMVSECTLNNDSLKKIKVVTTTKDQIKISTEWPDKTDICCWWCCHTFECTPCTLPTKYDSLRKRYTFSGIFCSWSCVKAYNLDRSDHKKYECASLISLLVQQLHGVSSAIRIKPAPPRQALKIFGGYLDIESFRAETDIDGYQLNLVKFNYIYPEITEIKNIKIKQEKKNFRLSRPSNV
jgi:hypothetical protein